MHVITKEPSGAAMQTPRTPCKAIRLQLRFFDIVLGTDRGRAERPRMRVCRALVIHGHIEETGRTQGFRCRLHFFQVAPDGFFTLVETEHGLECRWLRTFVRRVMAERVVHAMTKFVIACTTRSAITRLTNVRSHRHSRPCSVSTSVKNPSGATWKKWSRHLKP